MTDIIGQDIERPPHLCGDTGDVDDGVEGPAAERRHACIAAAVDADELHALRRVAALAARGDGDIVTAREGLSGDLLGQVDGAAEDEHALLLTVHLLIVVAAPLKGNDVHRWRKTGTARLMRPLAFR